MNRHRMLRVADFWFNNYGAGDRWGGTAPAASAAFAFDPAFSPDSVAQSTSTTFKVSGGTGPFVWTIVNTAFGDYGSNISWQEGVTSGRENILDNASNGCGTVVVKVVDDNGFSAEQHLSSAVGGGWVLLYQDDEDARESILNEFGLTDTVRNVPATYTNISSVEYWTETNDAFQAVEGLSSQTSLGLCCGREEFCDDGEPYRHLGPDWIPEQSTWQRWPTHTNGRKRMIFSAATTANEFGGYASIWDFWNETRPCWQFGGSYVMQTYIIVSLDFSIWGC